MIPEVLIVKFTEEELRLQSLMLLLHSMDNPRNKELFKVLRLEDIQVSLGGQAHD